MDILETNGVEDSTRLNGIIKISNSIGIRINNMSVFEAEKRLKKLKLDYQHNYEKYKEIRSNWHRFYIKANYSNYHSGQIGICISFYHDLREKLENSLQKLNKTEETPRGIERPPYHCKEFSKLHGCKSFTKENKILQKIEERQEHVETNDNVQETIRDRRGNWMFEHCKSRIPKGSNSKSLHKLLRPVKDAEKLMDEAIASDYNPTNRDKLTTRIEMEIKLLTKVIKKLKEEKGKETMISNDYEENSNDYEEKKRQLKKKCELICGKWDEEQRIILGLKKTQWFFSL